MYIYLALSVYYKGEREQHLWRLADVDRALVHPALVSRTQICFFFIVMVLFFSSMDASPNREEDGREKEKKKETKKLGVLVFHSRPPSLRTRPRMHAF